MDDTHANLSRMSLFLARQGGELFALRTEGGSFHIKHRQRGRMVTIDR